MKKQLLVPQGDQYAIVEALQALDSQIDFIQYDVNNETFVHELGHLMGFPDLYSYEGDYEFGPLGGFDMMDYNVGDHGPLNKLLFGWLQPLLQKKALTK